MKLRSLHNQDGQAATEFIIAAAFILVPLFLIVPLIGKYIDIKHAAIQHARYTAWEYTVWSVDDGLGAMGQQKAGIKDHQRAGSRKTTDTVEKGRGYFFTDPSSPTYGTSSVAHQVNPLWKDHRQMTLFSMTDVSTEIKEHDTPVPFGLIGDVFQTLFQGLGDVLSFIGKLLKLVGTDAKFDVINTKGYYTSDVEIKVRSLEQILPDTSLSADVSGQTGSPLTFKAKAAVQSNSWNSGSRENATIESRGLVVTSLLSPISSPLNKVLGGLNKILNKVPLLKIKVPAVPEFGYVEDDLIPFEHLEGNKKQLMSKAGLYSYEEGEKKKKTSKKSKKAKKKKKETKK